MNETDCPDRSRFSYSSRPPSEPSRTAIQALAGRMEDVTWELPLLSFTIERHGAMVLGSTKADAHRWTLDVAAMTASHEPLGSRLVRPTEPRLEGDRDHLGTRARVEIRCNRR